MNVCLIDDDPRLTSTLQRGFEDSGHRCETFSTPEEGLARLLDPGGEPVDVLLLDVMMPKLTGWDVLERARAGGVDVPTLFLTARQEVEDRVRGLDLGADDYVIKPFAFTELMARIRAVLRRHGHREPIVIGPLTIHRNSAAVELNGREVHMSTREHAFLELLATHPEKTFARAELLDRLWNIRFDPGTNVVDVLVARLRRKLGPKAAGVVSTVIGVGYRLDPRGIEG